MIVWSGLNKPSERTLASGRMQNLTKEVTPQAAAAVEKYLATVKEKENNGEIPLGAACVNNTCKTVGDLYILSFFMLDFRLIMDLKLTKLNVFIILELLSSMKA